MEISTDNNSTGSADQNQPSDAVNQTPEDLSMKEEQPANPDVEMNEEAGEDFSDGDDMASLMEMYEESFKRFAEGEVVSGKIISVDKDHVLVDIGYKSEGQIRIHEFRDEHAPWIADWIEYLGDNKTAKKIRDAPGEFKEIISNRYEELKKAV